MIEHGRFLINKQQNIIYNYFKAWPQLLELDLNNKDVNIINLVLQPSENDPGYITFTFDIIEFYELPCSENIYMDNYKESKYILSLLYDRLKFNLSKYLCSSLNISISYKLVFIKL